MTPEIVYGCSELQKYEFSLKELSFWNKLRFSNTYIFATQCRRPQIFKTMNNVRSNSLSLKYKGFPPSDSQDLGIRKLEFVAKTQFLWKINEKKLINPRNFFVIVLHSTKR